jgi:O-antigen ligase
MWYRLLAETGTVGFVLFVIWLLGLWFSSRSFLNSRDGTMKTIALAGQLALVAFIFEGFSIDSFGFPYLFFQAGLIASAGWIFRQQARGADCPEGTGSEFS